MNVTDLAAVYSITSTAFIKCIALLRDSKHFPEHTMILLCMYAAKLRNVQKYIIENVARREVNIKEYLRENVADCVELEKRISEETQISLHTH